MRRLAPLLLCVVLTGCFGKGKTGNAAVPSSLPGLGGSASAKGLYARLVTARGDIVVRLFAEDAPKTVENFIALAKGEKEWTHPRTGKKSKTPLYDGTRFFRVIPGFMIQGGDPGNTGFGGPGFTVPDEITPGRSFTRPGLVGMASASEDASGSQFFITLSQLPWLNDKHTIFGEVVEGMDVVEKISRVPRRQVDARTGREIDRPLKPEVLMSVRIEEK